MRVSEQAGQQEKKEAVVGAETELANRQVLPSYLCLTEQP